MSSEEPFCGATLQNVESYYLENIQGYTDIPICILGVIFNMFNMLVFTRRNMNLPVNLIFTHLAFANLSELLAFITYSWAYLVYLGPRTHGKLTYTLAVLLMRSRELINISNQISVCIIMMLAIWKYIAVFYPSKESQWCDTKTTRNTLVAVYIISILLFIPVYLSNYIDTEVTTTHTTITIKTHSNMHSVSQVIGIVSYELLPSLVLPILGVRLIATLWMKKEHPTLSSSAENHTDSVEMKQQTNRSIIISMIIVAQCLSFVIPTGLLDLVHRVFIRDYYSIHFECITSIRIIFYLLDGINKSVRFLVYYAIDQDFRVTFKSLFTKNNASFWKLKYVSLRNTTGNDDSLEIDRI